jgi:hypothetical protein
MIMIVMTVRMEVSLMEVMHQFPRVGGVHQFYVVVILMVGVHDCRSEMAAAFCRRGGRFCERGAGVRS